MKFVSVVHPAVGFASYHESKRSCAETGSQTEAATSTSDAGEDSRSHDEKEVQTDEFAKKQGADFDESSLASFLARVAPAVLNELDKNLKSTAFRGYELSDRDDGKASLFRWLLLPDEKVTSVDWNPHATRIVTGVASHAAHDAWCEHAGRVCVWGVSGAADVKMAAPVAARTTRSCVTRVAFHPFALNLVAAGTHSGEVVVWDLNREEDVPLASTAKILGTDAGEAVTCLSFLRKNFVSEAGAGHLSLLASAGLDGKIFLWAVNPVSEDIKLVRRFVVPGDEVTLVGSAVHLSAARETDVGVTCWDFSSSDPSTCVVGGEGGVVVLCSLLSTKLVGRTDGSSEPWRNPVSLSLQPHVGNVSGVAFSPVSGDVIASASNDGTVRIYNLKESTTAAVEVQWKLALSSLLWSPSRPLVLFVGTEAGTVEVFDLALSRTEASLSLSLGGVVSLPKSANGSVTGMKLNANSPRMLCVGMGSGAAAVWKLPEAFVSPGQQEANALKDLLAENAED